MASVDFFDGKAAQAWFEKQTAELQCIMSSRATLRVIANIGNADTQFRESLAKPALRCALILAVRGLGRVEDVEFLASAATTATRSAHSADSAFKSASSIGLSETDMIASIAVQAAAESAQCAVLKSTYSADHITLAAADSIIHSADAAASAARETINFTHPEDGSAYSAALFAVLWDIENLDEASFVRPLWQGAEAPEAIQKAHSVFLSYLLADPNWRFFHDWYLAMWNGTFTDWDIATEVAKIPDEIWEGSLEDLGREIERIEAELNLKREISSLKKLLDNAQTQISSPSIGHNQGPTIESDEQSVLHNLTIVWRDLETLDQELARPSPDPTVFQAIAKRLWEISAIIAKYCGGKIDIAIDKAVETSTEQGTKWAIRLGAGTYVATNEGIQSVAKAAWELAKTLGGS